MKSKVHVVYKLIIFVVTLSFLTGAVLILGAGGRSGSFLVPAGPNPVVTANWRMHERAIEHGMMTLTGVGERGVGRVEYTGRPESRPNINERIGEHTFLANSIIIDLENHDPSHRFFSIKYNTNIPDLNYVRVLGHHAPGRNGVFCATSNRYVVTSEAEDVTMISNFRGWTVSERVAVDGAAVAIFSIYENWIQLDTQLYALQIIFDNNNYERIFPAARYMEFLGIEFHMAQAENIRFVTDPESEQMSFENVPGSSRFSIDTSGVYITAAFTGAGNEPLIGIPHAWLPAKRTIHIRASARPGTMIAVMVDGYLLEENILPDRLFPSYDAYDLFYFLPDSVTDLQEALILFDPIPNEDFRYTPNTGSTTVTFFTATTRERLWSMTIDAGLVPYGEPTGAWEGYRLRTSRATRPWHRVFISLPEEATGFAAFTFTIEIERAIHLGIRDDRLSFEGLREHSYLEAGEHVFMFPNIHAPGRRAIELWIDPPMTAPILPLPDVYVFLRDIKFLNLNVLPMRDFSGIFDETPTRWTHNFAMGHRHPAPLSPHLDYVCQNVCDFTCECDYGDTCEYACECIDANHVCRRDLHHAAVLRSLELRLEYRLVDAAEDALWSPVPPMNGGRWEVRLVFAGSLDYRPHSAILERNIVINRIAAPAVPTAEAVNFNWRTGQLEFDPDLVQVSLTSNAFGAASLLSPFLPLPEGATIFVRFAGTQNFMPSAQISLQVPSRTAAVTVTAQDTTVYYNGQGQAIAAETNPAGLPLLFEFRPVGYTGAFAAGKPVNAGTYEMRAVFAGDNNFRSTQAYAQLTIAVSAAPTPTISAFTFDYVNEILFFDTSFTVSTSPTFAHDTLLMSGVSVPFDTPLYIRQGANSNQSQSETGTVVITRPAAPQIAFDYTRGRIGVLPSSIEWWREGHLVRNVGAPLGIDVQTGEVIYFRLRSTSSSFMGLAGSIAVERTIPAPPPALAIAEATHNSITLTSHPNMQFRIDGGAWQTSSIFWGLRAETAFIIEARIISASSADGSTFILPSDIVSGRFYTLALPDISIPEPPSRGCGSGNIAAMLTLLAAAGAVTLITKKKP